MRRFTTKFALVAIAGVILLVVAVLTIRPTEPPPMVRLEASTYSMASNQVRVAVFVLTNPAPVKVDYYAHTEAGGPITHITHGTLAGHSTILFQITPSNAPTRFVVNCAVHRTLRDWADETSGLVGLKTRPRSSEYSLFWELK